MTTLFISDLHLDAGEPETTGRFLALLDREALGAHALYILGDLFEAWVGDDDNDPYWTPIMTALARVTAAGVPCAVMHGNRDFLLGERFCAETGCRLLRDYEPVDLYGERVLLTHGDLLCTDDTRYMTLRAQLRDPKWQREFLARPLAERRTIAAGLRQLSATEIAAKSYDIMDVNAAAVTETMRDFDVRLLVHGHTHRPAVHHFTLDGRPAARIVLGAWHDAPTILRWSATGYHLDTLP